MNFRTLVESQLKLGLTGESAELDTAKSHYETAMTHQKHSPDYNKHMVKFHHFMVKHHGAEELKAKEAGNDIQSWKHKAEKGHHALAEHHLQRKILGL